MKIPFMSVFTSVFIIREGNELTVYDAATTNDDVENFIIPAVKSFMEDGCTLSNIVISHFHGDHAGGLERLCSEFENSVVYAGDTSYHKKISQNKLKNSEDGVAISKNLVLYRFPGHSHDCTAILDKRTKTMLTADAFQGFGILQYGVFGDIATWIASINKAKSLDLENLISSHEYFLLGQKAYGNENVLKYMDECERVFREVFEYGEYIA